MRYFSLLSAAACLIASGGSIRAASTTAPCTPGALTTYTDGSNSACTVGILVFNSFRLEQSSTGALGISQIMVTPVVSPNGLGGSFQFSATPGNTFLLARGTASYFIDYNYVIDPGPEMDNVGLSLDPGNVTITDFFCNDSSLINPGASPACQISSQTGFVSPPGIQSLQVTTGAPNSFLVFNPPARNFGAIETEIFLDASNGPSNFDSTTSTFGVVNSAPEPGSYALALSALLAIGVRRGCGKLLR